MIARLTTLVLLALSVLLAAPAQATSPLDAQWEQDVVYVYVRPTIGARWEVNNSLAQWSAVGVVQLVRVSDPSLANIRVRRQNGLDDANAGHAVFTATHGYFDYCNVVVDRNIFRQYRAAVMRHELGHCMGLADNYAPEERNSVMSYGDMWDLSAPSALDALTLRAIYAVEPVPPVDIPATVEAFPIEEPTAPEEPIQ
jgi:hypothetical protein